jgi:hypothetical protein
MLSFAERPASQNGLPIFPSTYQQIHRRKTKQLNSTKKWGFETGRECRYLFPEKIRLAVLGSSPEGARSESSVLLNMARVGGWD